MRRFLLVLMLFAIGAPLLLAGCGSSSGAEEPTMTKKQFAKRAEAFCNKEYRAEAANDAWMQIDAFFINTLKK